MAEPKHILYVAGAGLSKALQRSKRIPLMTDFFETMAEHLYNKVMQVSLAHFQLQHIMPWPTNEEIQGFAVDVAEHRTPTPLQIDRVARLVKRLPGANIEDVLSKFDPIKNRVSFAINAMFCDIGWDVNWDWLNRFLNKMLGEKDAKHTFLSFNYDLLLDRWIQDVAPDLGLRWSPRDGYGFTPGQYTSSPELVIGAPAAAPKSDLTILKPHGSLNWLVPFDGNFEFKNASPQVYEKDGAVAYFPEFEVQGIVIPAGFVGLAVFLVPPLPAKKGSFDFIEKILALEREALREADEVYILGWSMPKTDTDQVCLVSDTMRQRRQPLQGLTVVNLGAQVDYFDRVATAFGVDPSAMKVFNAGFCDFAESL